MKLIYLLLISIILSSTSFAQQIPDSCFTKKQVLDISYTLDSLYYVDSINSLIISEQKSIINDLDAYKKLDSIHIQQQLIQIKSLKSSVNIYEKERSKYYKWYNKKTTWFGIGFTTSMIILKMILFIK